MEKKILYISSADPLLGPGSIAQDHVKALERDGLSVDFLTLYKSNFKSDLKYIYKRKSIFHKFWFKIIRKLLRFDSNGRYSFFYFKETKPPVSTIKILKQIKDNYDIIIIYFWQNLLSFKSLRDIYHHCHSKPKVVFLNADYSTMTGGCHFFCQCDHYTTGCGNCPMINSRRKDDFTSWNVQYRQKVIAEITPIVRVNSYTRKFFEKSSVMKAGAVLSNGNMLIDHSKFYPHDMRIVREKYDIGGNIDFVILFGCQDLNEPRKGIQYLIDALNIWAKKLTTKQKEGILLVSLGKNNKELESKIPFHRKHLGYVNYGSLPQIYSMANLFLSPSIHDAGPSMVNQAIACGTPVVSFEIGSALDVIKDKDTGYTVPVKDTCKFADAINKIYIMKSDDYRTLRSRCRQVSKKYQSYEAFASFIKSVLYP